MQAVRRTLVLVVALTVALAGCVWERDANAQYEPSGAEERLPNADEYWMITIAGTAQFEPRETFTPCEDQYAPSDRTLARDNATIPRDDVQIAMMWLVLYKPSRCPMIDEIVQNQWDVTRRLDHMGDIRVDVRADGSMRVDGHEVPLGQELHLRTPQGAAGGWIQFVAANEGPWPKVNITP